MRSSEWHRHRINFRRNRIQAAVHVTPRVSNSSVTSRLCTLTLAEVSAFGAWFWRGSESLRAAEPQRLVGMLSNTRAYPTYNILEAKIEPISVERIRATSHCQVFCCSPRYRYIEKSLKKFQEKFILYEKYYNFCVYWSCELRFSGINVQLWNVHFRGIFLGSAIQGVPPNPIRSSW